MGVKVKVIQSCWTLCNPMDSPWNFPGQNTGVGSISLLQGSSQPRDQTEVLLYCRWILYQLSHKGSPRILEWVSLSFLQGIFPSQESNQIACIAGGFFTNWATGKRPEIMMKLITSISPKGPATFNNCLYQVILSLKRWVGGYGGCDSLSLASTYLKKNWRLNTAIDNLGPRKCITESSRIRNKAKCGREKW